VFLCLFNIPYCKLIQVNINKEGRREKREKKTTEKEVTAT